MNRPVPIGHEPWMIKVMSLHYQAVKLSMYKHQPLSGPLRDLIDRFETLPQAEQLALKIRYHLVPAPRTSPRRETE